MKKEMLFSAIVLAAIVGGIIFYSSNASKHLSTTLSKPVDTSMLQGNVYTKHGQYYDIVANYASSTPLLTRVSAEADATAVALMKKFVSETIKTDGDFSNLSAEDIKMIGFDTGKKEKLQIGYLMASSPRTISYIFTIYTYTLGAHGNTGFKTFTFDTESGALLTLADIFTPGAHYLDTLSSISRVKLPDVLGEMPDANLLNKGTTPENKNFETFFFDNAYLTILFAPYQVASYAAGPQTLRIPTSELVGILKPEYK